MEEGYELDLTYITERIIAVSFPRGCSEEIYSHNLKDVTRMLKSKHADNYLIINLSEKRHDLTRMNPKVCLEKTLDTGWPDMHAPPLDKICTICKAMEGWLNADPLHVVVIHCRGGKGRIGVVISSFVNFTEVSASADQALDRFAMRKYHDDKVSALMTPSQKRYVWILNSLLSGSMKINASPLFLHCVILHGIPNFDTAGVCRPYFKVYQGMQAVYSSGIYHIGPGHRGRVCIILEPAQLLKGDIMIKCYHKGELASEREVIFRLQFHTGAVQGYNLIFEKEDMESANKDPRFPDYGKVELVFSEGPERIPGADRWQNGADVIVDYNTADPLIRWDSYQNICDAEGRPIHPFPEFNGLKKKKKKTSRSEGTLGRGACPTSATSSPDHSDHALSVSSDSGLSSTSLWAEKPAPAVASATTTGTIKPNQGPSQQEKVELKRLLSGFGLEGPSAGEMDDRGPRVGIQQIVPAQVHINGDPRPRERETDILDDEITAGHDLRSVDSLGTLSSSCHKSSQNSLLSDGFGSPGVEEQQSQTQHYPAPHAMEEYERAYAEARRGCLTSRSNSVASANPSSASVGKQHVYRQGSYSTQSWVRQQQMVAAQQFIYMPENGNEAEVFPGNKQGSSLSKASQSTEPTGTTTDMTKDALRTKVPHKDQATQLNNNNNNKCDEEFKSLTLDIDNSIDQLNQLIMDLDPTFVPLSGLSSSVKRNGVSSSTPKCSNGINLRFEEKNTPKNTQETGKLVRQSGCGDAGAGSGGGAEVDSGVEAGSDMTPPTPAFPISPPTPYGRINIPYIIIWLSARIFLNPTVFILLFFSVKNLSELSQFRQTPSPSQQSCGGYRTGHGRKRSRMARYALSRSPAPSFEEQEDSSPGYGTDCANPTIQPLGNGNMDRDLLDGQLPSLLLPPHLPEKKRASDGEHSFRTASPSLSGFSSPHSGSSLSIPFPNVLPDLSSQMSGTVSPLPDVLAGKQVTVKFVQDTSKFWYKPDISRDQAISVLKDKEPGCFVIRDSHSFRGAYGLAMKVATPPPSVLHQSKKGDMSNELVRHFLIECTQKGVRLKGCPNEPYFGSLTALVCQHSITPLALPCKLIIPDRDPLEDVVETTSQSVTNSAAELLKQGAACNVWYLSSVEMESLTGVQAVQKATTMTLSSNPPPMSTVVHFKVSSQGITLTDNQRKLFFRRHYHVNTVIYCALDPQDRKWKREGCTSAKIFGFVARKTGTSTDNVCHLFAEHDPEQPASAIVNFVSKVMIGSQKSK
uniref:Tensin 3 n=1 Tax=Takifugu rubripes TaxID=31033 RepID=A0A674MZ69_TAKRU